MAEKTRATISRRQFAQRAAMVSASASLVPATVGFGQSTATTAASQLPDNFPKLSPEGQKEAEARFALVLARHGTQLSDAQKATTRMLCYFAQPGLERLRAFPLKNGDVPALFLRPLVEREKVPAAKPSTPPASTNAKQS